MTLPRIPVVVLDAIGLVSSLAALAIAYVVAVAPQQAEGQELATIEEETALIESTAKTRLGELAALERRRQTLDARLAKAVKLEPVERLNSRLNRLSEAVAAAAPGAIRIDKANPGAPARTPRFMTVPIRLAGSATYAGASETLAALHRDFPDTQVVGFRLVAQSQDETRPAPPPPSTAGSSQDPLPKDTPVTPASPATRAALSVDLLWFAAPADQKDQAPAPATTPR
ncbi:MAG: hypothetical protein ACT4PL_11900 [Phycisphaerales bacterium]